jgi:tetratricopeptide (TPR) repeat protein
MPEPDDSAGYSRRGWAFHSRSENDRAEQDFRKALALAPETIDTQYALGLVLKAQGRKSEAIEAFKKVVDLLEAGKVEDHATSEMMHRLSMGHINELSIGDWNLEEQIWHRI